MNGDKGRDSVARDRIFDYLEERLSVTEKASFEQEIGQSIELRSEFEKYQQIFLIERAMKKINPELSEGFDNRVMGKILAQASTPADSVGSPTSILQKLREFMRAPLLIPALATGTVAVLALVITNRPLYFNDVSVEPTYQQPEAAGPSPTEVPAGPVVPEVKKEGRVKLLAGGHAPEPGTPYPEVFNLPKESASTEGDVRSAQIFKKIIERVAESEGGSARDLRAGTSQMAREYGSVIGPSSIPHVLHQLSRDQHTDYGLNQRQSVTDQPVSTFGLQVDTASYSLARNLLRQGRLPTPNSVRVEEFVNYFKYDYPEQSQEPFSLSYELAPALHDPDRVTLKLGVRARDLVREAQDNKPWNLVFLIDTSGSMYGPDRLELVKSSLKVLVDQMRSDDRVGIVTYAGGASVNLEPTTVANKEIILQAIEKLGPGGGTYGSGGIKQAYQLARTHKLSDGVNRVILATDGDFNVGITDHGQLVDYIVEQRKSGVTLTVLGVGLGNLNDALMKKLALNGNGNYFYLDSFNEARRIFQSELLGTIENVADDVKIQVEFNPALVAQYRLIGYESRILAREDFNNDKVDSGEIGSGHTVTALYELTLVGSPAARALADELRYQQKDKQKDSQVVPLPEAQGEGELGYVKIRFKHPGQSRSELQSFPVQKSKLQSSFASASQDFQFASAVALFAEKLKKVQYAQDVEYSKLLDVVAASHKGDSQRLEFVELVKNAQALLCPDCQK